MRQMQEEGILIEDVDEPLSTVYEGGATALGFQVPDEFLDASLVEPRGL